MMNDSILRDLESIIQCHETPCAKMGFQSGRGAAWLARLLGVQEVPSSNLGGPTSLHSDSNGEPATAVVNDYR